MAKLCLNSRDSLLIINLNKVIYLQANGNYTNIVYVEGMRNMVSLGLSKMEDLIRYAYKDRKNTPFIRIGRSLLINQTYLCQINIPKQRLVLSDFGSHHYPINVSKQLLKAYKDIVDTQTKPI